MWQGEGWAEQARVSLDGFRSIGEPADQPADAGLEYRAVSGAPELAVFLF